MKNASKTQTLPIIKALEALGRKQLTIVCQHCGEEIQIVITESKYPIKQEVDEDELTEFGNS